MREVVGAVMAATVGTMLLWLILPTLRLAYNSVSEQIDPTDPVNQQLLDLGDMSFIILGFIVILVVGFVVLSYATRKDPFGSG
jgi:hypothetical protein